jgi:OOP family OmpA-OmpF porin
MDGYGYDDEEEEEGGGHTVRNLALAAVAIAVGVAGWIFVRPSFDSRTSAPKSVLELTADSTTTVAADAATAAPTTIAVDPVTGESVAAAPSADRTTTSPNPSADADATTTTTVAQAAPVPYPTLPDGSPEPIVAIFDTSTITLSGAVPSQAAKDRLAALAIANSKTPAALLDLMTINAAVPINVGVRVLELTSTRFPEGSADILPDHALEFDRVADILNALPNVSVLVVGHSDQRGSEAANYELSEERAQAVVAYLVGKGIDASRLASRAVGESDLLSIDDDDAALALNRRTEFVFYGLLVEG